MFAAGRESYARVAEQLAGYAAETDAERVTAAGEQILAVADLLRREPRLRRALADVSRDPDDRAGLLAVVLAGKIGDDALGLLSALVGARWATPGELLEAAERLGVDTVLAGADRAGQLADVEDELFRFAQIVSGDLELAATLADSSVDPERRAGLARALLEGKARPATIRLVELAMGGFGGRTFEGAMTRLVELVADKRSREVAYVTTATALSDADEQRLAQRLGELYGREISLKVDVDPSIVGGVRVQVGSDLYDGTVVRRLDEARKALAG